MIENRAKGNGFGGHEATTLAPVPPVEADGPECAAEASKICEIHESAGESWSMRCSRCGPSRAGTPSIRGSGTAEPSLSVSASRQGTDPLTQ